MMRKVWICTELSTPFALDEDATPVGWDAVGEIDSGREKNLWKHVQSYIGPRAVRDPRTVDFYLDGDPDNAWVKAARESDQQFQLAIDVSIERPRFLVAAEPATLEHLTDRKPEAHPSLRAPMFVGIRLHANDSLFIVEGA